MTDAAPTLADILHEQRDRIVARFVNELQRQELSPPDASRGLVADDIPRFLEELAGEASSMSAARRHGEQRWAIGYELPTVVREYGVLRRCILATAHDFGARPTGEELDALVERLDVAIAEAVDAYTQRRDDDARAQKQRFEFLAEAGKLLTSSLDYRSTISRLTALVVPRMADWCVVHVSGVPVDEMPVAHVDPSKRELLRDLFRMHPAPEEPPYGYLHVASTGEPQLVAEIDETVMEKYARDEQQLALMRSFATCSYLSVPLRVQGTSFGALILGYSDSRRHFDDDDFLLAQEVAHRAAIAIDNARLYAQSQEARSRVEAATRAKDEFVAVVSHELRTPLNAILGWVRLLRGTGLDAAKTEHAFEVIGRNADALDRLVADLLDVSRLLTGSLRISPAQLDLGTVVELAVETLRPAAEAKRIGIAVDLDPGALLRGDGQRLQQVAWNLVANAVKFTPKDGFVHVRVARDESDLVLSVEDNGPGIPPEFLPHVFEIFRQSDSSHARSHGGLGIGLSIVKHVVELHGGVVELASNGKGTTATVRLPVSPLVSTTVGVSRVAAVSKAPPERDVDLDGVRVLVVDDDPDARELVSIVLRSAGAEVHAASRVHEALAVLSTFMPHVVCSDLGLAADQEDGFALIRGIRSLDGDAPARVPAIALTGRIRHDDRARALIEGFNRYLAKPVEPAILLRAVLELAGPARG